MPRAPVSSLTPPAWRNRVQELRYLSPRELDDHPLQHKVHPDQQRSVMRGVLQEIGMADVLLAYVSPTTNRLTAIDGHLRKSLGDTPWPTVILDVDDAEAAYILAIGDELTSLAVKDQDALTRLLREVQSGDSAVQQLLSELAEREGIVPATGGSDGMPSADVEPQMDRAEELREQWGTKAGQLWSCGAHRIIVGDCTDKAVVEQLLAGSTPPLMVTDPPYGVDYDANWRNDVAEKGYLAHADRRVGKVRGDDRVDWRSAWELFPGNVVYCWHDGRHASTVQQSLEACHFEMRCQIIWAKQMFAISRGHYHWQHEPCWYAVRQGATASWVGDHSQTTLWAIRWDANVQGGHSTQKPLECMARAIRNHEAFAVYDPFLGSGTTLIACENLHRVCYGCEIDPGYVAVTLQRWADLTGQTPIVARL